MERVVDTFRAIYAFALYFSLIHSSQNKDKSNCEGITITTSHEGEIMITTSRDGGIPITTTRVFLVHKIK
jgi:hypothetical protein